MATPEQWPKIKEIVGAALDHSPADRSAFLDRHCASDNELRAEVESLLAAHADAGGLSESPFSAATVADPAGESKAIGPYHLIHRLGVGGMGQVWLAEQTEPVRRRVALKLIRAGMFDNALVQRFQSERQSLAMMEHPAIAKVFDAGATPEGQPYLAMEYVDGPTITEYCDRKKLGIRDRLRLFVQVCEGVQHAHQKAIIHRDLKPSNILVTEIDGKPQPRIIDFGLAKTTIPHAAGETLFTHAGGFLGTPGYMSPEQADLTVHDIDTRTDVYSLGVVLYELLTGFLPFDTSQWKRQSLDEVLRKLRDTDPERPSMKVGANRDTSTARAEARSTDPGQLVSSLRGDLDWITLKALEKERDRRYGTPSALANDVENYLQNRPVEARPASAAYRLRKYVHRNSFAVGAGAAGAVLLIAFALMQSIELRRISRERDRATRITEFMTSMFKVSDPSEARGNSITAREILDKSAKEIDTGLSRDPELQSRLLGTIGRVYANVGLLPQSREMLERALRAAERAGTSEAASSFDSAAELAYVTARQGDFHLAEGRLREILAAEQRSLGPSHRMTLQAMTSLAFVLDGEGKYSEAERVQREALDRMRHSLGPEDRDAVVAMDRLGVILTNLNRIREAEQIFRDALEIQRRTYGPDNPITLLLAANLAERLRDQGRAAESAPLEREILAARIRVSGLAHPDTLAVKQNLANSLDDLGQHAEAEQLYRETIEVQRRVLGPENPETLLTMANLAETLHIEGKQIEAEMSEREILAARRRALGLDHRDTLETMDALATTLASEGKFEEAKRLLDERLTITRRKPDQDGLAEGLYSYACAAAIAGHPDEALEQLRRAIDHGYTDVRHIAADKDLISLRGNPRFENLVAAAQNAVPVQPKTD